MGTVFRLTAGSAAAALLWGALPGPAAARPPDGASMDLSSVFPGTELLQPYTPRCAIPGQWGEDYPPRPEGLLDFEWPSQSGTYLLTSPGFWDEGVADLPIFTMTVPGNRPVHGWSIVYLDQYWAHAPGPPDGKTRAWGIWPTQEGRFGTSVILKNGTPRYCLSAIDVAWTRVQSLFGDGSVQLVSTSIPTGTACCESATIITLEPGPPRLVFSYGGYGAAVLPQRDVGELVRQGRAWPGDVLVSAVDPHWQYWPRNRIDSAPPEVILRVDPSGEHPEGGVLPAAMRIERGEAEAKAAEALPPAREALREAWARRSVNAGVDPASWQFWQQVIPQHLYGPMIELLYAGHPDLAWKLLRESWPKGAPGAIAAGLELQRMLDTCPHYPQLPWSIGRFERSGEKAGPTTDTAPTPQ